MQQTPKWSPFSGLEKNLNSSLSFGASSSYILLVQGHFLLILGHFPFVRTGQADHCWTSQLANEIGFFQGFLLKNHLLPPHYLGFDWSGWIVLINSEILIATGRVRPVSSDKWKLTPVVKDFVTGWLPWTHLLVSDYQMGLFLSPTLDTWMKWSGTVDPGLNCYQGSSFFSLKAFFHFN